MAINSEEINRLIDERDAFSKQLNIVLFAKMFNIVIGICNACKVDLETGITLLNVHHVHSGYVFNVFVHTPGTKKEDTIGEELFIDLPFDVVMSDNSKIVEDYMVDRVMAQVTPLTHTIH